MRFRNAIGSVWTALLATASWAVAPPDGPGCAVVAPTMYCGTAAAFGSMYPSYLDAVSQAYRGVQPNIRSFYGAGCSFVGANTPLRVDAERRWAISKHETFQMVHVQFGIELSHKEERRSPQGEYIGETTVTRRDGWLAKDSVTCGKP